MVFESPFDRVVCLQKSTLESERPDTKRNTTLTARSIREMRSTFNRGNHLREKQGVRIGGRQQKTPVADPQRL